MFLLKLLLKLLVLPVKLVVKLVLWAGIFLTGCSAVLLNLFAGLCFLLAIASYLMEISTGAEAVRTLAVGFAAFLLPHIAEWLLSGVMAVDMGLSDFLMS